MTAYEVLERFAKRCDPVYGPVNWPNRSNAYRMCALCGGKSEHNEENVLHEATCVWIQARMVISETEACGPASSIMLRGPKKED